MFYGAKSVGIGIILACVLPSAPTLHHTLAYSVAIAMTKDECIDFLRCCYSKTIYTTDRAVTKSCTNVYKAALT